MVVVVFARHDRGNLLHTLLDFVRNRAARKRKVSRAILECDVSLNLCPVVRRRTLWQPARMVLPNRRGVLPSSTRAKDEEGTEDRQCRGRDELR